MSYLSDDVPIEEKNMLHAPAFKNGRFQFKQRIGELAYQDYFDRYKTLKRSVENKEHNIIS